MFGASCFVVGASVPALAPSKLPATLDNVVGLFVPFGPFIDVITSLFGTSVPVPSGFG